MYDPQGHGWKELHDDEWQTIGLRGLDEIRHDVIQYFYRVRKLYIEGELDG